jgi:hypothetical protein
MKVAIQMRGSQFAKSLRDESDAYEVGRGALWLIPYVSKWCAWECAKPAQGVCERADCETVSFAKWAHTWAMIPSWTSGGKSRKRNAAFSLGPASLPPASPAMALNRRATLGQRYRRRILGAREEAAGVRGSATAMRIRSGRSSVQRAVRREVRIIDNKRVVQEKRGDR